MQPFEVHGSGPPLLFLQGSGQTLDGARLLRDAFATGFTSLLVEGRGLGTSPVPSDPYGMEDLASDLLEVLDHLGWDRVAVLGISFGGMVAQQLAVTVPERIDRLVLACTSSGGAGGSSYPLDELIDVVDRGPVLRLLVDTRFSDEWLAAHPDAAGLARYLEQHQVSEGEGYRLQMAARRSFDVWDRLGVIAAPTLVACGRYDGIAPVANSEAIAKQIPGAELRIYEGGHAFFVQDRSALKEITDFLSA